MSQEQWEEYARSMGQRDPADALPQQAMYGGGGGGDAGGNRGQLYIHQSPAAAAA
eukprot:SM008089S22595  [mRNA]  locus=s8089:3:442:- [translate_table: standard]